MDASDFHQSKAAGTIGDHDAHGSGPAVRVRPSDFKVLLCLGCGAYGRVRPPRAPRQPVPASDPRCAQVFQVRFKPTGRVYAMKVRKAGSAACSTGLTARPGRQVISKKHVRESNHVKYTIAERDVMTRVRAGRGGPRRDTFQPLTPFRRPPRRRSSTLSSSRSTLRSKAPRTCVSRPSPCPCQSAQSRPAPRRSSTSSWSTAAAGSSSATWWTRAF